jgi:nitrate/nitrite-specific signal transduction histidine kinase
MGRKISNPKLLKKTEGGSMASAFNQFADRLAQAKRKKIEKVGDTKQRLMEAKRTNKMLKVSKRTSKFALLEDQPAHGLTHRGQKITDLKEFNDINFGSDDDDEHFQEMHDNLNFTGFDEEEEKPKDDRPKSKT